MVKHAGNPARSYNRIATLHVDIIKHKGYPVSPNNDFDFYWQGLDFDTDFFIDDNDYVQADWKQYGDQSLWMTKLIK